MSNYYPKLDKIKMRRLKTKIKHLVSRRDAWYNGDLNWCPSSKIIERLYNISVEDVEKYATSSCSPNLWVWRTICRLKLGITVRHADWLWYNI